MLLEDWGAYSFSDWFLFSLNIYSGVKLLDPVVVLCNFFEVPPYWSGSQMLWTVVQPQPRCLGSFTRRSPKVTQGGREQAVQAWPPREPLSGQLHIPSSPVGEGGLRGFPWTGWVGEDLVTGGAVVVAPEDGAGGGKADSLGACDLCQRESKAPRLVNCFPSLRRSVQRWCVCAEGDGWWV